MMLERNVIKMVDCYLLEVLASCYRMESARKMSFLYLYIDQRMKSLADAGNRMMLV